jgi:dTDP-4-amino-4,6-dideoxygalactose transaminase
MVQATPATKLEIDPSSILMPQVCTFWKGRVALYVLLKCLGVGDGDGVLVPGYTCAMVPGAVRFAGAKPIYADIDSTTYNATLDTLQQALTRSTGVTVKALVLQHTYGIPANVVRITDWARRRGIAVIEDCAHALGSRYRDVDGTWREVGTGGDAAIFSSQWSKPVSTGLGGWMTTSDLELARRVRQFRSQQCISPSWREALMLPLQIAVRELFPSPSSYWIIAEAYRKLSARGILVGTSHTIEYQGEMPQGYAKRMSAFQEWLLQRRLADRTREGRRRQLRIIYDQALAAAGLPVLEDAEGAEPILVRYPVRVGNKDELLDMAHARALELGDWFNHPVHPKEANALALGYQPGACPEAEQAARETINLPMHAGVTEKIALLTVEFLKQHALLRSNSC